MNKKIKIEMAGVPLERVDLTPCAEHDLISEFRRAQPDNTAPDKVILDMVIPLVCGSTAALIQSDYMKRSEWFRTTKSHTVNGYVLRHTETKEILVSPQLILTYNGSVALLESPIEHPLYETYEVDRLLEETRVELGVI